MNTSPLLEREEQQHTTEQHIVMDVRDITKSLPLGHERIEILKGISFQIMGGEFISIVGPSGSGKSTLLGIIAGLDNPTTGQVLIDGVDITHMGEGKGLVAALRELAADRSQQTNIVANLRVEGSQALSLEVEEALYRVAQEP